MLSTLFSISIHGQASEIEVESKISSVTVFKQGAQVTRKVRKSFKAGISTFKFIGISAKIDKESIQLNAEGGFTILSITSQLNYFEPPRVISSIEELENTKDSIILALEMNKAQLKVLDQEEQLILTNQSIGGNQSGVKIDELKATSEFYRSRLTEISTEKLLIKRENRDLNKDHLQVNQQIIELNANEKSIATTEVLVKMEAKQNGDAKFELSYFVEDALWFASYDIRVKDVSSPTDLTYKANITQDTDEDWNDVKLILSTGEPTLSGQEPGLSPWRLGYYRPGLVSNISRTRGYLNNNENRTIRGTITDASGEPLIGASVMAKGTTTGTVTDLDGSYEIIVPAGATELNISYTGFESQNLSIEAETMNVALNEGVQLDEVVVVGYGSSSNKAFSSRSAKQEWKPKRPAPVATTQSNNTTTHEFEITTPFTIPADNKPYTVNINQHEIPAYYAYSAVPKLDQDAFLRARLTDWEQYHLLSGETSLFFENTFIGRSYINVENTNDTLNLSLGRDQNVVIKRNKQEQFSSKNLVGNKTVEAIAWQIDIRNKKDQPINLKIKDQIPVSVINEIDVKLLEGGNANYDKDTGMLTWQLRLNPGESQKLNFKYQVKYPNRKKVALE